MPEVGGGFGRHEAEPAGGAGRHSRGPQQRAGHHTGGRRGDGVQTGSKASKEI